MCIRDRLDTLYGALPENWLVAQEFMVADAGTFLTYNANMRQLCYDKMKSAELIVFNRFKPEMDKMESVSYTHLHRRCKSWRKTKVDY